MSLISKLLGLQVIFCLLFRADAQMANLGEECWSNFMCILGTAECVRFECVCRVRLVPNHNNTLCTIPTGEECENFGSICYDPNASCWITWREPSACTCNDGFGQDPETTVCKPLMGANCTSDGLPCLDGSCVADKCQCADGLVPSPNRDRCGITLHGSCAADNPNCADPHADCNPTSNTCQCAETYQQVAVEGGILYCKRVLGAPCEADSECAASNATCEVLRHGSSACTCQHGYVPSESRDSCLEVTNHWPGTCQENRQCTAMFGRYSHCQSNSCVCATGYTYVAEDSGCVPQHAAVTTGTLDGIKLLATTLLSYLPSEAETAVADVLNRLNV